MAIVTTWDIQIVTHSIHIRKDPVYKKDGSNVVGYAHNGNKFTASKYQNGWFYIDAKKGWMKEKGSSDGKTYIKVLKKNTIDNTPPPAPKPAATTNTNTNKTDTSKNNTNNTSNKPKSETHAAETVNKGGNLINVSNNPTTSEGTEGHYELGQTDLPGIDIDGDDDVPPNYYPWADKGFQYTGVNGDDEVQTKYPYQDKSKDFKYTGVNGDDNNPPKKYAYQDSVGPAARWNVSRADKTILTAMTSANMNNLHFKENWGLIPNGFDFSYNSFQNDIATAKFNLNVMNIDDREKHFTHMNRFRIPVPDMALSKTIPYVFFTRPELSLINSSGTALKDEVKGDSLFSSLFNDQPRLFHSLDSAYYKDNNFNMFLSNSAMSFQTSDEVIKTVEHGETYTGWKMVYGRHTNESNTAGQFSIQYIDDYNYNIYKMHKLWISYINKVYRGEIEVSRNNIWQKILTYPCAVYYIVCAPDGETILFWSKYFGVFPINTPSSASSFTHGATNGFPEFSINYMYSVKEDMNPVSLREFNLLSSGKHIYRETYNSSIVGSSRTFVNAPYIDDYKRTVNGKTKTVFKLRFRNA